MIILSLLTSIKKKHATGDKIVKEKIPFLNHILYKLRAFIQEGSLVDIMLEKLFIKKFFKKITILNKKTIKNKNNLNIKKKKNKQEYLINTYKEDINKLEKLLNVDLSNWKK